MLARSASLLRLRAVKQTVSRTTIWRRTEVRRYTDAQSGDSGVTIKRIKTINHTEELARGYNALLSDITSDVHELSAIREEDAEGPSSEHEYDPHSTELDEKRNKWTAFKEKFTYPRATHTISELSDTEYTDCVLYGYLSAPRIFNNLIFINLFDFSGAPGPQIVSYAGEQSKGDEWRVHKQLAKMKHYTPVAVVGRVGPQDPKSKKRRYGDPMLGEEAQGRGETEAYQSKNLEMKVRHVYQLNEIDSKLMFTRDAVFGPEQRHLQIRTQPLIRRSLKLRNAVAKIIRSQLEEEDFTEIETPLLFKSTPEGAREFLVPTRQEGLMYALPQSPQQYKQILMASGISRYFQFAKCFRDEDLRADRQPEFTQLDLEMSFATSQTVMNTVEKLVANIWAAVHPEFKQHYLTPFPIYTYHDVMKHYGIDKPDLRITHSRIRDVTVIVPHLTNNDSNFIVEAFAVETKGTASEYLERFTESFKNIMSRSEFQAKDGEHPVIAFQGNIGFNANLLKKGNFDAAEKLRSFLSAREDQIVVVHTRPQQYMGGGTKLGLIRDALLKEGARFQVVARKRAPSFAWIVDFPLFQPSSQSEPGQGGEAGLTSTHHPFTAPRREDLSLLETQPLAVRAEHFDLVVNGVELGGGSARIHDPALQKYILQTIMRVPQKRMNQFSHLIEILGSGCPPHAGMAMGFDRLIALLDNRLSIRDVIAFPKSSKGYDLLVNSPGPVTDEQLAMYHLERVEKKT